MPNERKHLKHIRTVQLQYVKVLKADIPVSASVVRVDSVPTPAQIAVTSRPNKYIQTNGNNWYYELTGKRPSDLADGEIAVAFQSGYERLYIKNSAGTVVEFRPYSIDKTAAYIYQAENPALSESGSQCEWEIPYSDITECGVSPRCASVALREVSSGKQTVPDVVFDDVDNVLRVSIYTTSDLQAGTYRIIITGQNYGE